MCSVQCVQCMDRMHSIHFERNRSLFLLLSFFIFAVILPSFALFYSVLFCSVIEAEQQIEADEQQQVIFWLCHLTCYQWSYVSCLCVYRGFSDEHDMVFGFPWKSFNIQRRLFEQSTFALSIFRSLSLSHFFGFLNVE